MEFIKNNRKTQVFANKEVIVSAGAVNSPTLLMLSGIGPKEHLQDLGVYRFKVFVTINRNHLIHVIKQITLFTLYTSIEKQI